MTAATARPMRPPISARIRSRPGAAWRTLRAATRCGVFVVRMMPFRVRPIEWVTRRPVIETVSIPTTSGAVTVDVHRPPSRRPHPGVVVAFGINPTGAVDPRVAQMGDALARAGFAALLYWSPTMRDLRLAPGDIDELVAAYDVLLQQPYVEPARSGFLGVCIGASFALMAAASPAIRDRVTFVVGYAPYSSMWTLAVDITTGTRSLGSGALDDEREPWEVDPLTWKTYVRCVTGWLEPAEAQLLRDAHENRIAWNVDKTVIVRTSAGHLDPAGLSADGRAALRLLTAGAQDIEPALRALPPAAATLLGRLSPLGYLPDVRAPRIALLHDRYDHVIPVGESRRLWSALANRPGARYTELGLRHLKMPKEYSLLRVVRELGRSYLAWYPLFDATTA